MWKENQRAVCCVDCSVCVAWWSPESSTRGTLGFCASADWRFLSSATDYQKIFKEYTLFHFPYTKIDTGQAGASGLSQKSTKSVVILKSMAREHQTQSVLWHTIIPINSAVDKEIVKQKQKASTERRNIGVLQNKAPAQVLLQCT
jgi:hypothetical protein